MKVPAPPTGLSAASKKIWQAVNEAWILGVDSTVLLETALGAYDRLKQAQKQVDRDGITIKSPSGLIRPHPSLRLEKEAAGRFLQAWKQIGFGQEAPAEVARPIGRPGGGGGAR